MNEKEESELLGPPMTLADLRNLPPRDDRAPREDGLSDGALFRAFLATMARARSLAILLAQSHVPTIDSQWLESWASELSNMHGLWGAEYMRWRAEYFSQDETTSAREFGVALEELLGAAEDAQRRDDLGVEDVAVARALLRLEYGVARFTDADSEAGASRGNLRHWRR